jgi:hypothetical protein
MVRSSFELCAQLIVQRLALGIAQKFHDDGSKTLEI